MGCTVLQAPRNPIPPCAMWIAAIPQRIGDKSSSPNCSSVAILFGGQYWPSRIGWSPRLPWHPTVVRPDSNERARPSRLSGRDGHAAVKSRTIATHRMRPYCCTPLGTVAWCAWTQADSRLPSHFFGRHGKVGGRLALPGRLVCRGIALRRCSWRPGASQRFEALLKPHHRA